MSFTWVELKSALSSLSAKPIASSRRAINSLLLHSVGSAYDLKQVQPGSHYLVIKGWFFFLQPYRNTDNKYICSRGGTEQVPLYWRRHQWNLNQHCLHGEQTHNLQHLFWAWTLVRIWYFPKMGHVFWGLPRLIPYLVLLNQVSDFQTI